MAGVLTHLIELLHKLDAVEPRTLKSAAQLLRETAAERGDSRTSDYLITLAELSDHLVGPEEGAPWSSNDPSAETVAAAGPPTQPAEDPAEGTHTPPAVPVKATKGPSEPSPVTDGAAVPHTTESAKRGLVSGVSVGRLIEREIQSITTDGVLVYHGVSNNPQLLERIDRMFDDVPFWVSTSKNAALHAPLPESPGVWRWLSEQGLWLSTPEASEGSAVLAVRRLRTPADIEKFVDQLLGKLGIGSAECRVSRLECAPRVVDERKLLRFINSLDHRREAAMKSTCRRCGEPLSDPHNTPSGIGSECRESLSSDFVWLCEHPGSPRHVGLGAMNPETWARTLLGSLPFPTPPLTEISKAPFSHAAVAQSSAPPQPPQRPLGNPPKPAPPLGRESTKRAETPVRPMPQVRVPRPALVNQKALDEARFTFSRDMEITLTNHTVDSVVIMTRTGQRLCRLDKVYDQNPIWISRLVLAPEAATLNGWKILPSGGLPLEVPGGHTRYPVIAIRPMDSIVSACVAASKYLALLPHDPAELEITTVHCSHDVAEERQLLAKRFKRSMQRIGTGPVLGTCVKCGRQLTDPQSAKIGIGPDCLEDMSFEFASAAKIQNAHRSPSFRAHKPAKWAKMIRGIYSTTG
ncbi:DUF6011 domain-containing protein [Aestuariimicrobium soli]|uniref:DUF6011 domain-containing protein n=1 Tax=Aestuariimicrobium soli TaxID=2035834 RepID=UPI003EC072EF